MFVKGKNDNELFETVVEGEFKWCGGNIKISGNRTHCHLIILYNMR